MEMTMHWREACPPVVKGTRRALSNTSGTPAAVPGEQWCRDWCSQPYVTPTSEGQRKLQDTRHAVQDIVAIPPSVTAYSVLETRPTDSGTVSTFKYRHGRPLSVSGRPCYILPMLFIYFFLWPPYSPALVNGGSRKFYTWWTLSTWLFLLILLLIVIL